MICNSDDAKKRQRRMKKLCRHGFLTCTSGKPGDDDARYVPAWLPLPDGEFPEEVRRRHAQNMRRIAMDLAPGYSDVTPPAMDLQNEPHAAPLSSPSTP